MVMVRATATMYTFLEWEGEIPSEVPEERWGRWIRSNVDGGDFVEFASEWEVNCDLEVLDDD